MIFASDFDYIANEVRSLLKSFGFTCCILRPDETQLEYDDLLCEFNNGDITYTELVVHYERMDVSNDSMTENKVNERRYGNTPNNGDQMIKIPDDEYTPDMNDIFVIDNSSRRYTIRETRKRIGEWIVLLQEYENPPKGTETILSTIIPFP